MSAASWPKQRETWKGLSIIRLHTLYNVVLSNGMAQAEYGLVYIVILPEQLKAHCWC